MPCLSIPSPVGELTIAEDGDAIVAIRWADDAEEVRPAGNGSPLLAEAARQLDAYFAGDLTRLRPAARSVRLAVRDRRLDGDGGNPVWRDPLLRRAGGIGRLGAARHRAGLRQEPDPDRHPLPSSSGQGRSRRL